ncbi:hypothetical protein ACFZAT_07235 [Streptomyces sp. NPDC008163]|uniref:hypothetical protein n=1 Tax=Streptomyces sp. NPDC008163 TaxID=3364818 RepID=UPI0036EFEC74
MSEPSASTLSSAQGRYVPDGVDFAYRGHLVRYEAPKIARSVLQTGFAIPTREPDVCALDASSMISATGMRHVAHPDDAASDSSDKQSRMGRAAAWKSPDCWAI